MTDAKTQPATRPIHQTPFVPAGKLRPMFFMHIPKTSGSSWNATLSGAYGKAFTEHAEYQLPQLLRGEAETRQLDCVSGHIPFNAWRAYPGTAAYGRMTVLRDPWARLISHINWIDRFNNGYPLEGHGPATDTLAAVAKLINETDFEDRKSLAHFCEAIRGETFYAAFDNLQVRMLFVGKGHPMKKPGADPSMLDAALATAKTFDGLGICEDGGAFQADVMAALGKRKPRAMPHENKGVVKRVHTGLDLAFDVLYPLFELDQVLYRRVRGIIAERRRAHGTSILPAVIST